MTRNRYCKPNHYSSSETLTLTLPKVPVPVQAVLAAAIRIVGTEGCSLDAANARLQEWDLRLGPRPQLLADFGVDTREGCRLRPHFFNRFDNVFQRTGEAYRVSEFGVALSRHFARALFGVEAGDLDTADLPAAVREVLNQCER